MLQKQLVLYVDTFALLWECFSFSFSFSFNQFFFHKEKYFKQSCIENENLHFMFNGIFFGGGGEFVPFMRKCGKICRARQATDEDVIWRMR